MLEVEPTGQRSPTTTVNMVRVSEGAILSYVAPKSPKGGLKTAKRPIFVKNRIHLKKVCYNVTLCENCHRQSCKAFIGLTNRTKMIGGGDPFCLKFWIKLTALE